jgi:hypothetical protein
MMRSVLLVLTFSFSAAWLPSQDPLQERLNAALASRTLRQAYFDTNGDPPLTLEQAFPHLAGATLADTSFLVPERRPSYVTERVKSAFKEQGIKTASDKLTLEPA